MLNKRTVSNRKHTWKVSVEKTLEKCERIIQRARAGDIITLADIYKLGHRIHSLGLTGRELSKQCATLTMQDSVLEDIGQLCFHLENYSAQLRQILYKRGMMTKYFPVFESRLPYKAVGGTQEKIDPLKELERIMSNE